jgi:serine phosphatase RsbU (regulator of sigma subunit)
MHWNWFTISHLINCLAALTMGCFVYFKNKGLAVNKYFALMCFFVALWAGSHFVHCTTANWKNALFFARISNLFALFISVTYLHFILELLGEARQRRLLLRACYLLNTVVFVLSMMFPDAFLRNVKPKIPGLPNTYCVDSPGILYVIYTLIFIVYVSYALLRLLKGLKINHGIKRLQIKYNLVAGLVGFSGGGTMFFLPYNIPIPPYPNVLMSFWTIAIGFAIIRYKLFDIETVIHRTILWVLTSCVILVPIGLILFFIRSWLVTLNWFQLTFLMTGLFYLFLFCYRSMQPKIDHLFRRRKYDYYQVLGEIGQKIGSELDINSVIFRLFKELKDVLYIRNGLALVQQPGERNYAEAGSIGYDVILNSQKEEKVSLDLKDSLARWLQIHQKALEREQVEVDPQYGVVKQGALAFLSQNSIEVLIPVIMEGKVNALIGIGKKENLQSYTFKDIELLENMGRQIGITIDNALHHEDIVEKERLAEEMKLGREIQINLLPRETPEISGLIVQGIMQPAKEIGGDYYDFITLLQRNQVAVVIGDVSGKGVAAGLLMAMAKTAVHTLSQEESSPKEILLKTNNILSQHIGGHKFMTMLYLTWDPEGKKFFYSSAGHEHILIYRSNLASEGVAPQGTSPNVEAILSGGFMLGMMPDIGQFLEDKSIVMNSKDKVVLYTDGVTEARNPSEEFFGLPRLIEAVSVHGSEPAKELLCSIKDEVYTFIGTREQYDDITLVVMEAV